MRCGHEPGDAARSPRIAPSPTPAPRPAIPPTRVPARSEWSKLVEYLRSCVVQESLLEPVPLAHRQRWAALPITAETILCGNDVALPPLPEVTALFGSLEDLEAVFYGWPTVVVVDERERPHVAPLFRPST